MILMEKWPRIEKDIDLKILIVEFSFPFILNTHKVRTHFDDNGKNVSFKKYSRAKICVIKYES